MRVTVRPCVCVDLAGRYALCTGTGRSPARPPATAGSGPRREDEDSKPMNNEQEKSDLFIVTMKPVNKPGRLGASIGKRVRVNEEHRTSDGRVMVFHTTRWDLVLSSGNVDSPQFGQALAELCSIYWYPLYAFARRKGFSEHDAQDLTQSFFLHLLEKTSLKQTHPEKGRFRAFLLASFQNHISVYWQHARALKRGGGSP